MILKLNNLYEVNKSRTKSKRLGRGRSSGLGKTSGKGHKGQKSRKGVSIRWFEGGQTSFIKRLPKRGFNNINSKKIVTLNFRQINYMLQSSKIKEGDLVDISLLKKLGFIKKSSDYPVKLLSYGDLDKKLDFKLDFYSGSSKAKIESLGGKCN